MKQLEEKILNVMIDTGRAAAGWKIKVIGVSNGIGSDWVTVSAVLTRPRCRKPCMAWELAVYMPRDQIWWDKSTFARI